MKPGQDPTTFHVRRAIAGESGGAEWVVERFTPLLLAQARYRLGRLRAIHEPEDVVANVWAALLPKLGEFSLERERTTPAFIRYLSNALLLEINNLLRKRVAETLPNADSEVSTPINRAEDAGPGPVTRAAAAERRDAVLEALQSLDAADREVLILRGIEQHSNAETAQLLGIEPNTAAQRFRRALTRLRERLPGSVFDDLQDEAQP